MQRRRRIALYGGTFDPVHAGHAAVARNLAALFALDEVVFVPAHVAPHKRGREVSAPWHRFAMLALATQAEEGFRVSPVELDEPERPYTVETLARWREESGAGVRLFFVMGADSWEEITTWREWERVLSLAEHLVVTRPGHELPVEHVTEEVRGRVRDLRGATPERAEAALAEADGPRVYLTDVARVDLSATQVRRAAREGVGKAELSQLVAPPVADYILKYGLYREADETSFTDAGNKQTH